MAAAHKFLPDHECTTVQRAGWGGIKNGDLLGRAEGGYELFVTADQNMRYQQNLAGRKISILELSTNDYHRMVASVELVLSAIAKIQPGEFVHLKIP